MSNGAQCCAIEVCCDMASLRTKLPVMVAKHAKATMTGHHTMVLNQLLDWMEQEGIAFAPASIGPLIQDVLAAERNRAGKGVV